MAKHCARLECWPLKTGVKFPKIQCDSTRKCTYNIGLHGLKGRDRVLCPDFTLYADAPYLGRHIHRVLWHPSAVPAIVATFDSVTKLIQASIFSRL